MTKIQFETVAYSDLEGIRNLQPDGWPDIVPEFEFYIKKGFCNPIKTEVNDRIVGIGTSIIFSNTSWLAHIIVDKEYRKKGIGFKITEKLLEILKNQSIDTCLLIATEPGQAIYQKAGFKIVTEYIYLKRIKTWIDFPVSGNVLPYRDEYYSMIIELDKQISGENREILLRNYLHSSMIYLENNEVKGYYIPDLGEGLINAETDNAGLELMKVKYSQIDKSVLPSDNVAGIEFLKQNGFAETDTKGTRMILGNDIDWKPEKIFSRIGGNYG